MSEIKIFEMDDCDWMAATSLEEAIACYANWMGFKSADDYLTQTDDEPRELTDDEMQTLMFQEISEETDEPDGQSKSFRQKLDEMIAANEEFPTFFASTEF